jgi:hypothetical protein
LGDATVVEIVQVEWPSGAVQEIRNAAINQLLIVTEPARLASQQRPNQSGFQLNLIGGVGFTYAIEVSTNLANWMQMTMLTNSSRTSPFADADATHFSQRFYRAKQLGMPPNATQ